MYKDGILTIGDWTNGMADSPYQGFSTIANCEVFETPGVLKIANKTTSFISSTLTGTPIAYVKDSAGSTYYLTSDAKFYKNDTLISDLGSFGWDLCLYNDYIIISRSGGLDCYGPISTSPVLSSGWKSTGTDSVALSSSYYLKLIPAKDGNLYITNGAYMAKISSFVAGVSPAAPTATLLGGAMGLPANNAGVTAVEIGAYMVIGTQALNGSYSNKDNGNVANLYLWDKSDTKPISLTGSLNESSIQSMFSYGNSIYVMAGSRGNLYLTNTTSFSKIKRIPWNQNRLFGATTQCFPNAISMNINGNLLIGTSTLTDSFGADVSTVRHGVWEVQLSERYPIIFKQQISTGNVGQTQSLQIGFIYSSSGATIIGWKDGSTYGIDTNGASPYSLYTSNAAKIESQLFLIGSRLKRKTFTDIEFVLGKPLTTGQEITISYRKNLTDSYTQIGNYTYTTLGGIIGHNDIAKIADAQLLQLKITLTQPTSATFGNNIELINVTLT